PGLTAGICNSIHAAANSSKWENLIRVNSWNSWPIKQPRIPRQFGCHWFEPQFFTVSPGALLDSHLLHPTEFYELPSGEPSFTLLECFCLALCPRVPVGPPQEERRTHDLNCQLATREGICVTDRKTVVEGKSRESA